MKSDEYVYEYESRSFARSLICSFVRSQNNVSFYLINKNEYRKYVNNSKCFYNEKYLVFGSLI